MAGDISNLNPDMPYDLRQTYAMNILTPILTEIEDAREQNQFQRWYNLLYFSLHTNIHQKLDVELREEFNELHKKTLTELNNPELKYAFCGQDKTPAKIYRVQMILKELELWLRDKMQKSGLFGNTLYTDMDDDGL